MPADPKIASLDAPGLHYLSLRPAGETAAAAERWPRPVPFCGLVILLGPLGNTGLAVTALGYQVTTFIDENKLAGLGRVDEGWNKRLLAVLAWSALMATSLVFALVLQALVTTVLVASGSDAPPAACQTSAGAAPPEGDDASPRFFADICGGAIGATPISCSVPATEDEACIS